MKIVFGKIHLIHKLDHFYVIYPKNALKCRRNEPTLQSCTLTAHASYVTQAHARAHGSHIQNRYVQVRRQIPNSVISTDKYNLPAQP